MRMGFDEVDEWRRDMRVLSLAEDAEVVEVGWVGEEEKKEKALRAGGFVG